jgi:hypothetical protein
MDKARTIYKLRKFKNEILISILTLALGISIFFILSCFETTIISFIHKKTIALSFAQEITGQYNDTLGTSYKIFNIFEKGSLLIILFALESFIITLFFIRMSSKTPRLAKMSSVILCIGTATLGAYYILSGFYTISNGIFSIINSNTYFYLKLIGIILIGFANILFIQQAFNQIVLEKDFN